MAENVETSNPPARPQFTLLERVIIATTQVGAVALGAWCVLTVAFFMLVGPNIPDFANPSKGAAAWKLLVVWPALGVAGLAAWLAAEAIGEFLFVQPVGGLLRRFWPGYSNKSAGLSGRRLVVALLAGAACSAGLLYYFVWGG